MEIPPQSPSFRISGGTVQLINSLYQTLNPEDVLLNQTVKAISRKKSGLLITANEEFEAQKVVMAIPPKLWSNKIQFNPILSNDLIQVAKHTHTWMEDAIKVAITFDTPFWKEEIIPASLFSNVGPVTEFYEHGNEKRSTYALCGFVNASFARLEKEERKSLVFNQLKGVYGNRIKEFTAYHETVWSKEENTFVDPDTFVFPHQNNGNPFFRASFWEEHLIISSSESASTFPGYMDGAINAGRATAEKIKQSL
jgi:monoamine oxidase